MKGMYCLVMRLTQHKKLRIGKRLMAFRPGYYCYVGSALNNLENRVERHNSKQKKKHWHIDYLTPPARIIGIKAIPTTRKLECQIASKVGQLADGVVKGFGCSDCRCKAHLYFFKTNPVAKKSFNLLFSHDL